MPARYRGDGGEGRRSLPPVKVEIWSDVVCPWCHVGKARFEEALRRLGEPIGEYLRRKFGSAATVEAIEGRVGEAGAELGLAFDWSKVRRVNTFDAHRLLEWALVTAGAAAQRRLKGRLMQAYFTDGGDVADHAALASLAGETGLDPAAAAEVLASGAYDDEVRAAEREARELEIHAVPTFVVEGRLAVPGAQEPETFVRVLARMRSRLAEEAAQAAAHLDDAAACAVDRPDC
jgi:predicted DsbA family dithiol-disulfide isomerase